MQRRAADDRGDRRAGAQLRLRRGPRRRRRPRPGARGDRAHLQPRGRRDGDDPPPGRDRRRGRRRRHDRPRTGEGRGPPRRGDRQRPCAARARMASRDLARGRDPPLRRLAARAAADAGRRAPARRGQDARPRLPHVSPPAPATPRSWARARWSRCSRLPFGHPRRPRGGAGRRLHAADSVRPAPALDAHRRPVARAPAAAVGARRAAGRRGRAHARALSSGPAGAACTPCGSPSWSCSRRA